MSKSSVVLTPADAVACCSPLSRDPLSAAEADRIVPLPKALADPVRLRPASVSPFVLMQLIGGLLGYALIRGLEPNAPAVAADAVATHT